MADRVQGAVLDAGRLLETQSMAFVQPVEGSLVDGFEDGEQLLSGSMS